MQNPVFAVGLKRERERECVKSIDRLLLGNLCFVSAIEPLTFDELGNLELS